MRILLLKFSEILRRVFPFCVEQEETAQLESGLRINRAAVCFCVKPQSILQIVCALLISRIQLDGFDVSFKRERWNLGGFLNDLILRRGKGGIALIKNLLSQPSLNVLQRRQRTAKIKLARGPTAIQLLAERSSFINLDHARGYLHVSLSA